MHKFFTEDIKDGYAYITGEDVRHAWKVLRLKAGDEVELNNLSGTEYTGVLEEITKDRVSVKITGESEKGNESPFEITLFQGIPKGQKMELICQKACELGCVRVVPLITERVIPDAGKEYRKLDRLKRIILEASKQSKRSRIMDITEPISIDEIENTKDLADILIVPYENAEGKGIKSIEGVIENAESAGIVIGPEGGFEEEEIKYLEKTGAHIVTLGPRILRTETAGMAVMSVLQYIRGDFGGKV